MMEVAPHTERFVARLSPPSIGSPPAVKGEREPLWTRDYALIVASLHLFFLGWSVLFATLPLYLEDARKWQVGWVVGGAFGIASLLVRIPSGRLTDQWGRRPMILFGGLLAGVTLGAHALTADPLLLTPIRLLNGVGMCLYTTAAMAMLADTLPVSRRGEGMGWYGVIYTLTNVYGPWLGAFVAGQVGLQPFFAFAAALTIMASLLALPLRERIRPALTGPAHLISRAALLPAGTFMTLTIAFSVLPAFLALYTRGQDIGRSGVYFVVLGLALVPSRWFGGVLADRYGRAAVIYPGLVLAATGMLLLAGAQSAAMLYASGVVFGFGFGLGHTGLTILTVDRAAPEERGVAIATLSLAWDAGTIGSFALGFLGDTVGLDALFGAAGVLPLVAVAGFYLVRRRATARPGLAPLPTDALTATPTPAPPSAGVGVGQARQGKRR